MKKMRILFYICIGSFILYGSGCTSNKVLGEIDAALQLELADHKVWESLDENTPEQLALKSSSVYKEMMNGELTPEDSFEKMREMATEQTLQSMSEQELSLINSIRVTSEQIQGENDAVESFDYSICIEDSEYEGRVTIYRIQNMKSGKQYYFKQDFIEENGTWKIYGDNVENPFSLKKGGIVK